MVASEDKPVGTPSWRRIIWLKRRGLVVVSSSLGPPSLGCPSLDVGCENIQVEDIVECGDEDADVVVDEKLQAGRFGGFLAPCEAGRGVRLRAEDPVPIARFGTIVGHGEHR